MQYKYNMTDIDTENSNICMIHQSNCFVCHPRFIAAACAPCPDADIWMLVQSKGAGRKPIKAHILKEDFILFARVNQRSGLYYPLKCFSIIFQWLRLSQSLYKSWWM